MEPDKAYKLLSNGRVDPDRAWMPEMELPLQAQTLETLTADARRMQFPDSGLHYAAHAAMDDKTLRALDFKSIILGDENDVPSELNQDNINKMVEGLVNHWHKQYDMRGVYDAINAVSFKYGTGVARLRTVQKRVFMKMSRGIMKQDQKFPVLIPMCLKRTYLDDSTHSVMMEGQFVGPAYIVEYDKRLADLRMAANRGSSDPERMDGGWMPKNLKKLEGDKNGIVKVLEYEGDMVLPRKTTGSVFIPNVIASVAVGDGGNTLFRLRYTDTSFSTVIEYPYHVEDPDSAYATSPLMKGMPIQKSAVDALNRLMMSAALNVEPPIGYDGSDMTFAQHGGPRVFPGALWGTISEIIVHKIGSPEEILSVYIGLLQQYADVTGVNAPRLGAQTVSHTTAFAKEAELNRGVIRTVDYVRSMLQGPMAIHLDREYQLGRKSFQKTAFFIPQYGGYVEVSNRNQLPETVLFELLGSGGPGEEAAKAQQRLQSAQLALQVDSIAVQLGREPSINHADLVVQILKQGGWTDVDAILAIAGSTDAAPGGQPVEGGGFLPGVLSSGSPSLVG